MDYIGSSNCLISVHLPSIVRKIESGKKSASV